MPLLVRCASGGAECAVGWAMCEALKEARDWEEKCVCNRRGNKVPTLFHHPSWGSFKKGRGTANYASILGMIQSCQGKLGVDSPT